MHFIRFVHPVPPPPRPFCVLRRGRAGGNSAGVFTAASLRDIATDASMAKIKAAGYERGRSPGARRGRRRSAGSPFARAASTVIRTPLWGDRCGDPPAGAADSRWGAVSTARGIMYDVEEVDGPSSGTGT
eukprot:gene9352-13485_t